MNAASGSVSSLVSRFPSLEGRIPRILLCDLPTPVERRLKLESHVGGGPLYFKRDDRSARLYGGNKPRKLEWLLGRARSRRRKRVMTFGALGTNHGLATALYASHVGLACELVLVPQPVTASVRRRLLQHHAAGARLHLGRSLPSAAGIAGLRLARHPRMEWIPIGGSSPHGTLGFVNAGLELAEQIAAGELPEPARIYVPCGSGGSAAGLALGLTLAGLRSTVIAVLVTDLFPPGRRSLDRQIRRASSVLRAAGAGPELGLVAPQLELERAFVGPGYGHRLPAAETARALVAELEGIQLDSTYGAKALAALAARERTRHEPVLFWNTYAAAEPELSLSDWRELPRPFHRFFRGAA